MTFLFIIHFLIYMENELELKVVILGVTDIGKTCIISKYVYGTFNTFEPVTSDACYKKKILTTEGTSISLFLWDTPGIELFRSRNRFFMIDSDVGIFVYDPFRRQTFEELSWYVDSMKSNCRKNALYILCENKSDIKDLDRKVTIEEAEIYADTIGAKFCKVSAKTGEGLEEMFQLCGNFLLGIDEIKSIKKFVIQKNVKRKERTECIK